MKDLVLVIITLMLFFGPEQTSGQNIKDNNKSLSISDMIRYYNQVLKDDPENLKAATSLMESYYQAGHFRKSLLYANISEDIYKNHQRKEPETNSKANRSLLFYIYQTRGKARHKIGDFRKAMIDYQDALAIAPDNPDLLVDVGNLYYNTKKYDSALYYFRSAEEKDPMGFKSKFNMANTFYVKENYDSALYYYKQSILIKDDFPYAYFYRGTIYNETNQYEKAVEQFNRAIEIWPDKSEIYFRRAIAQQALENHHEALADWNMVLLLDSLNYDALRNRALLKINTRDYKEALSDLKYLIDNHEMEVNSYFIRGRHYFLKRKYDKALVDLKKAIDRGLDSGEIYYMAGYIYRKRKNKPKACEYLSIAHQLGYKLDNKSEKILKKCNPE